MHSLDFSGKTVLVTGGSRGPGKAMAKGLASDMGSFTNSTTSVGDGGFMTL